MINRNVDNKVDWLNFLPVFNKSNRNWFWPSQSVYSTRVSCKKVKKGKTPFETSSNFNLNRKKIQTHLLLPYCLGLRLQPDFVCLSLVQCFPCLCWPSNESSLSSLWTLQQLAAWQQASWIRERLADFPSRRWETKWRLWFHRTLVLQEILCVCQRLNNYLHVFYEF